MPTVPSILYDREMYISRLRPYIGKQVVKVLTGPRRVGKSYILFSLMRTIQQDDAQAHIIYINKEDLAFADLTDCRQLYDYVTAHRAVGRNYIFIDEVQMIDGFHNAVRSLALDEDNDIYITGSNSRLFSSDLANELGGRYVEFRVNSLTYVEFCAFHHLPDDDDTLRKYVHFGGLPYLIHLPLEADIVREYLLGIYNTVVLRDVVERKKIRNTTFLSQLIHFLADNVGSLFSSKRISDYLKSQRVNMAPNQVADYADALSDAFFVHRVGRYDIAGKRFFERGEKYYFENLGLLAIVAGYSPQNRAKRLENLVFCHLIAQGYEVRIGTLGTEEVDFVCTRGGETLYVQVAIELSRPDTIEREFGNLLRIKDNFPKLVVSAERTFENTYQGIRHIYIRDFLCGRW